MASCAGSDGSRGNMASVAVNCRHDDLPVADIGFDTVLGDRSRSRVRWLADFR